MRLGWLSYSTFGLELNRALGKLTPPAGEDEEEELSDFPNRDQAWNFKFAEFADIYRWSERASLSLQCGQELLANERNDIGYNPRAIVWEENLCLSGLLSGFSSSSTLRVFHRCKHDIDNSDREENDVIEPGFVQKRTLILGGLSLSRELFSDAVFDASSKWSCNASIAAEYYAYKSEYRYPLVQFSNAWSAANGSVMINASLGYKLGLRSAVVCRVYSSETSFSAANNHPAAMGNCSRFELGYRLEGEQSAFTIALVNERLFDEIVRISADPTNTWSVMIALRPNGMW